MLVRSNQLGPSSRGSSTKSPAARLLSLCAFSSVAFFVVFTLFFFSASSHQAVDAADVAKPSSKKTEPHVGPGGQLPRDKQQSFMPEGYDIDSEPPAGFDPTAPPPGFDEKKGTFTNTKSSGTPPSSSFSSNSFGSSRGPASGRQQQQRQNQEHINPQIPTPSRYPGGVSQEEVDRVAREYELRKQRGEQIDDDDETNMVWGSIQGGSGKKPGRKGKKDPEPPKSKGKGKKLAQNTHIGEEIKTSPRLEAVKKIASHLVVLYHAPSWPWCESCFALENATRTARLVVDRWASYTPSSRGKDSADPKSSNNNNNKNKKKQQGGGSGSKKNSKKPQDAEFEDDNDDISDTHDPDWQSAPENAAARFAWVDCSASGVHGPFHPCADLKSLPALGIFVNNSETPLHWYEGFTDSFSVLSWIRSNVPNSEKLQMTDDMKQEERGMIERKKIERQSSLVARLSPKEAMEKAKTEPILALLYEQDCRTCHEDTVLLETVARFNSVAQQKSKGAGNKKDIPASSNKNSKNTNNNNNNHHADSDELDEDHEMPLIARIPVDNKVRSRWLGHLDVPQLAYFDVTSPNTPQIYYGQRNATDLLAYARFVSRLDVKVPKLPLNSKAVSAHPNVFGPNTHLRIHSAEELRKYVDESNKSPRLLYVHSTWQRPSDITAEAGDAVDYFNSELRRRKGSRGIELRVLLLCALRPHDRNQILDMKIFSRRVSPFFILVSGGKTQFIDMRVTRANLAHFGEEMMWLATPSPRVPTTNVSAGHSFVEFNTLAPLIVPEKVDDKTLLLLPFDFYSDREDFYIFVYTSTGGVESAVANDRGLLAFDKASREIRRLLDQEDTLARDPREKVSKVVAHNVSFGVVDIARFPEIRAKVSAADDLIKNGLPIVIQLKRKKESAGFEAPVLIEFGSALSPYRHAPWDAENGGYKMMLARLLKLANLPDHPDTDVLELTASNFERILLDPTMGVLVMFYSSNSDPHSESMMTPYRKVAAAFRKDTQTVRIAQLDIELLDGAARKAYKISHVPVVRWFAKGSYDKGIGEAFPGTPFSESMIEFVSEEMDLPYFDLEQMRSGGDSEFPPVMYKDFDAKITREMHRHVVLYLSRGRFRNEAKLTVLQKMQKYFDARKNFQDNFTFARVDAIRYNKKLRKSGLVVDPDDLPMLVYMPPGINKFEKIVKFDMMASPFAEPTIARWICESAEFPYLPDSEFNYTEDELDRERDPPITGIKDLDQTSFMGFVASRGDRVVMFYAPWCKASREFMPTFSKVANHFEGDDTIEFGRIDIPQNEEIGHQQGIQAFPTIITYFEGSSRKLKYQGEYYPGGPSGEGMIEYLTTIRQSSRVQALESYRQSRNKLVVQFNASSFRSRVTNGSMHTLVEFGVDWCGHCRYLETVMEDIAEIHATNRNRLVVGYVNCEEDREICTMHNITDYPRLVLFRRDPLKTPDGKTPATLPVRAEYFYREHRVFDEIQGFVGANIPSLALSQQLKSRYGDKRNREEGDFFEKLVESKTTGRPVKLPGMSKITSTKAGRNKGKGSAAGGMPQTQASDTPEAKKKKEEERRRIEEEEVQQAIRDGRVRPGSGAFTKPKFTSFPAHVSLLDYDSFIKHIDDNKLIVVINYEEPEDNDEMVSFAMMATSLQPLVERGIVKLGAIAGAAGDAGIGRLLGRHPSITFFRGLGTPSHVRFDTSNKFVPEGDGGDMNNVTHLLKFVEKHLKGAGKSSYELTAEKYDLGTQDPNFTTAVFFYAPWDEQCRKIAQHYDAVAQIIGHHDHIILTRVDISRSTVAYMRLGKRPLPAVYVYDKSAKDKAREQAWSNDAKPKPVTPRYMTKTNPSREDLVQFILAEDPKALKERQEAGYLPKPAEEYDLAHEKIPDEDPTASVGDSEFKDLLKAVFAEEKKSKEAQDAKKSSKKSDGKKSAPTDDDAEREADIIYMPAIGANELDGTRYAPLTIPTTEHFHITMREFKHGALIFFTAEYCAHCPKFEDMYHQAVGPMRNRVVVALMDVTKSKAVMRRCGVRSLPALVYVRPGPKPGSEDDDISVVHFTGQKTVEEFVKFGLANVQGLPVPAAGSLPPYPELTIPVPAASEESAKDLELIQRGRSTAEELVTNVSTSKELEDAMYAASTPDESTKGVLFVYVSSWCGDSCARVREISTVVANAMENAVRVVVVNVTSKADFRKIQQAYDVRSVPLVAMRCTGDDGSLKRIQGSQLSLRGPGWVRRSSENIAVLFESFCMKRYSKEQLRSLSSMVPEAVVKEVSSRNLAELRGETGLLVFIRNGKACRMSYDCRETQKAVEQFAVKAKSFKDARAKYVFVDATGDKTFKSALKNRGIDLPAVIFLDQRSYESEESDEKTWLDVLIRDMFAYESRTIPTVQLLDSFITQQLAREKALGV